MNGSWQVAVWLIEQRILIWGRTQRGSWSSARLDWPWLADSEAWGEAWGEPSGSLAYILCGQPHLHPIRPYVSFESEMHILLPTFKQYLQLAGRTACVVVIDLGSLVHVPIPVFSDFCALMPQSCFFVSVWSSVCTGPRIDSRFFLVPPYPRFKKRFSGESSSSVGIIVNLTTSDYAHFQNRFRSILSWLVNFIFWYFHYSIKRVIVYSIQVVHIHWFSFSNAK